MSLRSNCSMPQPHVGFLLPPRWPLLGPHLESLSGFLCLTFKAFFKSLFSHMVDVPNMVRLSLSRMPQGPWGSSHILSRGHGLDSCPVHATSPGWGTGTKHPLFGLSVCPGLPPQCPPPGPQELEPGAQASVRGCSYMLQGGKLEGSVGSGGRRLGELGGEADVRHGAAQGCRQLPHQWLGLQGGKGGQTATPSQAPLQRSGCRDLAGIAPSLQRRLTAMALLWQFLSGLLRDMAL